MPKGLTNTATLDRLDSLEIGLEINSFAGGENTIGADHELKVNEARVIKNWEASSLGSMIRAKGFNNLGDGSVAGYTQDFDLLIQHFEGSSTEVYGVIEGDLVKYSGGALAQDDNAAFTSGTLCHAVSAGSALWITNATDNLKRKTIAGAVAAATDLPATAHSRIYEFKARLVAEGNSATVEGSRAGTGTWNGANAWDTSGDSWSITLPDLTQGAVMGWPSGSEITVFTKFNAFALSGFPNVVQRTIQNGHGCSAPLSIARGNEGVFFISEYPTKGVFLWDGVSFTNLTEYNNFIDNVNLSQRIFGIYRNRKYHLFYNESGSGVTYPNRWRIYDTRFGRWMERPVNTGLSDNFGYPALLTKSNNELYVGSSIADEMYELETSDNDDEGNDTQATYETKEFTSADFKSSGGGGLPDNMQMKIIKMFVEFKGTAGTLSFNWSMDRNRISGGKTVDLTSSGHRLNSEFTLNTSYLVSSDVIRTAFLSFPNSAIGYSFKLQILNNGQTGRPEVRKIKIYGKAIEEI